LRGYGEVRSHTAIFSIPVPNHAKWVWRRPDTQDGAAEYWWDFIFEAQNRHISVGFFLFKLRADPDSGPLSRLLSAGQWTAWNAGRAISRTIVAGGVDRGRLHMTIRDSALLAELFADRPRTVSFILRSPGDTVGPFPVQLRYRREPQVSARE